MNSPDVFSNQPENAESPGANYAANITSGDSDQIFDEDLDSDMLVDDKGNIAAAIEYDEEEDEDDDDVNSDKPFGDLDEDENNANGEMKEMVLIKKEDIERSDVDSFIDDMPPKKEEEPQKIVAPGVHTSVEGEDNVTWYRVFMQEKMEGEP